MPRNGHKRRCSAMTRGGHRCRNWVRLQPEEGARDRGEGPFCHIHSPTSLPGDRPRCTARTASGARCRQWPMAGKTLCNIHAGHFAPEEDDERRCTARRADGQRCQSWGMPHSQQRYGRMLCRAHSEEWLPAAEDERRCTAIDRHGGRCPHWSTHASRARGKPLCRVHAGDDRMWSAEYAEAAGRRCTATTMHGERCGQWALPDSDRQLCRVHAYPQKHPRLRHGYYRQPRAMSEKVQTAVKALAEEGRPLAAELLLLRLKLGGVLAFTNQELTAEEWGALARLVKRALRKIARLEALRKEAREMEKEKEKEIECECE